MPSSPNPSSSETRKRSARRSAARRGAKSRGGRGVRAQPAGGVAARERGATCLRLVGEEQFGGAQSRPFTGELAGGQQLELKLAGGHVTARDTPRRTLADRGARRRRRRRSDEPVVCDPLDGDPGVDGAWRDDPHDATLHEPAARRRDLLRNRHAVAGGHEPLDVALQLVVEAHRRVGGAPPRAPSGAR